MQEFKCPSWATPVADPSAVNKELRRSVNHFYEGDTIAITNLLYSREVELSTPDKNGNKQTTTVYYVKVNISHRDSAEGYDKLVPLACFRRLPRQSADFLDKVSNLQKEAAACSTVGELFRLLQNRTVKVSGFIEAETIDYNASNLEAHDYKFKLAKFACYELCER